MPIIQSGLVGLQAPPTSPNVTSALTALDIVVHSKELLWQSLPRMEFLQFAVPRLELGAQPGHTIRFIKHQNINRGGKVKESVRLVTKDYAIGTVNVTVHEFANATSVTDFLLLSNPYDQMEAMVKLLSDDYAKVVDEHFIEVIYQTTPTVMFGNGTVASRAALVAGNTFTTATVRYAVTLAAKKLIPMFTQPRMDGGGMTSFYICFVTQEQCKTLMEDSAWTDASLYAGAVQIFTGEVGMYYGVRFIKTTQTPIIKAATGNIIVSGYDLTSNKPLEFPAGFSVAAHATLDVHAACLFGDYVYAIAEGMPVGIYTNGILDFGREHDLAWRSVMGAALLNNDRIIVIETAQTTI